MSTALHAPNNTTHLFAENTTAGLAELIEINSQAERALAAQKYANALV